MFRKLFAARSSRLPAPNCSRRLELEALEDRITPTSAIAGVPPGLAPGGSFSYGPSSSVVATQAYPTSYPEILGAFGYSPEAFALATLGVGLPVGLSPYSTTSANVAQVTSASSASTGGSTAGAGNQLAQLEQVIGTLAQIAATQNNPQQVLNLAIDEFFQAADTFALLQSQSQGVSNASVGSLQSYLAAHETAIAQNPVDHTPVGQMLGTLVYDATVYMLAANQSGGV